MTSYKELVEKAQELMAQAEELKKKELESVINTIKAQIEEFELTAADLGFSTTGGKKKSISKKMSEVAPKYRSPNGEEWSGRGRSPKWLAEEIAKGKTKEDFAI